MEKGRQPESSLEQVVDVVGNTRGVFLELRQIREDRSDERENVFVVQDEFSRRRGTKILFDGSEDSSFERELIGRRAIEALDAFLDRGQPYIGREIPELLSQMLRVFTSEEVIEAGHDQRPPANTIHPAINYGKM